MQNVGDPVYTQNYRPGSTWEPTYVTEVMGPRRYKVKFMNEDQFWHWHQNQLHYCHVEDDNTQSTEISDSTGTSPVTGDSPRLSISLRVKRRC